MLEIERLSFTHASREQQYCYTLRVAPGEIVAIIGRSGAGKSTLLDLIAGFLGARSGTLSLNGDDLIPLAVEKRPVSILFQADNLFDHLGVNANLSLGLTAGGNNEQAIAKALQQVGLDGFGRRRAGDLSGGQQQRVALARTLLRNKPVLLLDEPFASLDHETAASMRSLVRTLTREHQWCTLIVSHLREDANGFADRSYGLAKGKLTPSSSPAGTPPCVRQG